MRTRLAALALALCVLSVPTLAHFVDGQVWLIDFDQERVYRINPDTGIVNISLDASDGLKNPGGMGFTGDDWQMLVANYADDTVLKINGGLFSQVVLDSSDGIAGPLGGNAIIYGPDGSVYISNSKNSTILKFDEDLISSTVVMDAADGLSVGAAMVFTPDGDLLVANRGGGGEIFRVDGAGVVTTYATFATNDPTAMAIRKNGDIYVATLNGDVHRMIGGNPGNTVLLGNFGAGGNSHQSLGLTENHTLLYHVNSVDGIFRSIHPVTGAATTVATVPGNPNSMVVLGSHYPFGSFTEHGTKKAGTGFFVPRMSGVGEPRLGALTTIQMHDFVGGAPLFIFVSPFWDLTEIYGGEIHVGLGPGLLIFELGAPGTPGVGGEGDLDIPFLIPNAPGLVGAKLHMQTLGVDAGASEGVSFSNRLTMVIGE